MTKKKLFFIIGIVIVAMLLVAVCIEASIANAKSNVYGDWQITETGINYDYTFNLDGTVNVKSNDASVKNGKWSYSWYKVTLELEGEELITLKCKGDTLTGDTLSLTKKAEKALEPVVQVNFFKNGFFGYAEKGNFKYWSFAHFFPLILYGLGIFLIFHYREKLKNWKHEENFRFIFAAVMLFAEMSYFWRLLYVGSSDPNEHNLLDKLPLQVCEWTCILAIFMITKKSKWLYPICFYVCLTIGIFPLLTPSVIVTAGPAYYRYYQYWLEHILPPLAVFYMTFVHGFRPTKKGIIPATCFMGVLVVFALICNANIEGANYLYIAKGTSAGGGKTLMDPIYDLVGGSQPLLLLLLAVLVIGIFFGAYYAHIGIRKLYDMCKTKKKA